MTADALRDKLTRALADLGDTPETVAAVLQAQGCLGLRVKHVDCPVSRYLSRILGYAVSVDPYHALVLKAPELVVVPLPPAVEWFVRQFDAGAFPELTA